MFKRFIIFIFLINISFNICYAEDYSEKITDLEQKKKKTEILLNSAKKKENEIMSRLNQLTEEEKSLQEEMDFVQGRIDKFKTDIIENMERIDILKQDVDKKKPAIDNYIVYIYKRKNWDYSRIFFESGSFNTFLKKYRIMKRIIKEELLFLDTIKTDMKELEETQKDINEQKKELDEFYLQLEIQKKELEKLEIEKKDLLEKVRKEKEELEEKYLEIEKDYQKIVNIIKKHENNDYVENKEKEDKSKKEEKVDLDFSWPLTSLRPVLLPYGQQYNEFDTIFNNQGIDIQFKKEDWVIASESGRVAYKGQMSGLGKIVIIKHSGDFTSVYTFLDDIFVRIGQKVKKKEKLATVMINADNPEKSMLHFEIRKMGEPVDPENYIKIK